MFTHYRTQGFFLKEEEQGEANRLFTVFTEDFGKLKVFGRAIRKIKSKLRTGLGLFYISEIEFIQGKGHKTLTDVILINNFKGLKTDLKNLKIAYQISEILDDLIKGQEPDKQIWQLLNETFNKLNNLSFEIRHLSLVYYYFLWNFFSILGYQIELYKCALCQEKLQPEKNYFNMEKGGLICQKCFKKVKSGKEISRETVKILRIILKKDWSTLSKLKVEPVYLKNLNIISKEYYLHIKP